MNRDNRVILLVFFPITAYLFVGTLLFFIVTRWDQLAERLGNFSRFPGIGDYPSTNWHERSIWLTVFFPITWPLVFAWILCVVTYSAAAALCRLVHDVLKIIWEFTVDLAKAAWEWITDAVKAIWQWTVDSMETIWETMKNPFRS
jgi:hypothetical protein